MAHPAATVPPQSDAPHAACAVGVVGLGIMGSLYARHLIEAGFSVAGCDTSAERCADFVAIGGLLCDNAPAVVASAPVVVIALSATGAYRSVMLGDHGICQRAGADHVFVDTGTFPIPLKEEARRLLAQRGAEMIDAPVTGTRVHAERKKLVMYASGSEAVVARIRPLLETFAEDVRFVGAFGSGMKLKLVTNHLVAIHNVATAEALALAASANLDLQLVYDLIAGGPASSAVFGFRGPMMIADCYEPATMRMDVFDKDLRTIGDFARGLHAPTPLLDASTAVYRAALAQGMTSEDVSATFRVFRGQAAVAHPPPFTDAVISH